MYMLHIYSNVKTFGFSSFPTLLTSDPMLDLSKDERNGGPGQKGCRRLASTQKLNHDNPPIAPPMTLSIPVKRIFLHREEQTKKKERKQEEAGRVISATLFLTLT